MGDFMNTNQNEFYWQQPNQNPGFYEQDYSQFTDQQLGKSYPPFLTM